MTSSLESVRAASNPAAYRWHLVTAVLLSLVMLELASFRAPGGTAVSAAIIVLSTILICALWCMHLSVQAASSYLRYLLTALLGYLIVSPVIERPSLAASDYLAALGCGVFVYIMLWVADVHKAESSLRPVATLALLLSVGILAKPAVAMSCVLVSLVFFIASRRNLGGAMNSALLMFTPAALCMTAFFVLKALAAGTVVSATPPLLRPQPIASPASAWFNLLTLSRIPVVLWFAAGVLLIRAFRRESGFSDLAYLIVIAFLSTAGVAHWMPDALSTTDIRMVAYGGACCLFAMTPLADRGASARTRATAQY
jgi:hypothetical protein